VVTMPRWFARSKFADDNPWGESARRPRISAAGSAKRSASASSPH
jgi:hypothetical protein